MTERKEQRPAKRPASSPVEAPSASLRSYVLRVWIDDSSGEMRGYLSDARTHIRRPFSEASELPSLIRSLFDIHAPKPDE
jgi:hypothetical protein